MKVNTPIAMILAEGEDKPALKDGSRRSRRRNGGAPAAGGTGADAQTKQPAQRPPVAGATEARHRAAAEAAVAADPDVPEGTEMVTMTMREALRDAMAEEMRRDGDVFVMGEEVAEYQGAYKVTQGLLEEFGARRVIDTPITEHGFAGLGVGAALRRPEADRRVHDLQFRHAGDGPSHQFGGEDALHVRRPGRCRRSCSAARTAPPPRRRAAQPGLFLLVLACARPQGGRALDAADAKGLLKAAIRDPNPVIFLENEILYGVASPVPEARRLRAADRQARVVRAGNDVTLVAWSIGMTYALKAADELAKENISAEVIDLRTLKPMDIETVIELVKKTGRLVTVEEGWQQSGVGAEIAARVMEEAFDYLDAPVARVSGKDVPMPYAANLEKLALPSSPRSSRRRGRSPTAELRPIELPAPCPSTSSCRRCRPRWKRAISPNG